MTQLLDTCVAALLVSDCRDREALHRFQRAARRVEELLASVGFPETAKTLRQFREECGEFPDWPPRDEPPRPDLVVPPSLVAEPCDDPLVGRTGRKRKAVT